jgi:hypothetical protein
MMRECRFSGVLFLYMKLIMPVTNILYVEKWHVIIGRKIMYYWLCFSQNFLQVNCFYLLLNVYCLYGKLFLYKDGINMQIVNKSIRIIDYENNRIYSRNTPDTFDEYVGELIAHINTNNSVRDYKTRSSNTEVISCILQILEHRTEADVVLEKTNIIANRLLSKEIEAQGRVSRLDTHVQKGSLIQALLFDDENESFTYLLAKVEHSDFVDDSDFTFKTGFSKDKKTIWKSCLFDLQNPNEQEFHARIYSNTVAKYWSDSFLELNEMISDESNTTKAFNAIESALNRNIKNVAPRDHTIIRNAVILYFKSHEHIDYEEMINTVLDQYQPVDYPEDKFNSLREKIRQLPDKAHFDRQFNSVPSVINARIKKIYEVNNGIELRITNGISDIEQTISAYQDADGIRYIKIKTNNEDTFRRFYNPG